MAEQVQSEQISIPRGKERPQPVRGIEKNCPWSRTVRQQGLQRWLPCQASTSTQRPSRVQKRLRERREARSTAPQKQVEGSIIQVTVSALWLYGCARFYTFSGSMRLHTPLHNGSDNYYATIVKSKLLVDVIFSTI